MAEQGAEQQGRGREHQGRDRELGRAGAREPGRLGGQRLQQRGPLGEDDRRRDDEQGEQPQQHRGDGAGPAGDRPRGEALVEERADSGRQQVGGEDVGEGVDGVLEVLAEHPHADDLQADAGQAGTERHEVEQPRLAQQVGVGVARGVDRDGGGGGVPRDRWGGRGRRCPGDMSFGTCRNGHVP
ncbi:hypothetical protein [Nannocystis pusilla]|uniref:hypothetical protein n=1 Tax=Nannocystis pusilla TaxID=889268 RepID=UPI003B792152